MGELDQCVLDLRKQAKDCQFGTLRDDLMLHVLVWGVDSVRMRRCLRQKVKGSPDVNQLR